MSISVALCVCVFCNDLIPDSAMDGLRWWWEGWPVDGFQRMGLWWVGWRQQWVGVWDAVGRWWVVFFVFCFFSILVVVS